MYPWNDDSAGRGDDPPIPPRSFSRADSSPRTPLGGDPSPRTSLGGDPSPQTPFVRAVQVALDRRDNGGDALTVAGQPAATQPAATQPAATQPAATQPAVTQPAAGRARQ